MASLSPRNPSANASSSNFTGLSPFQNSATTSIPSRNPTYVALAQHKIINFREFLFSWETFLPFFQSNQSNAPLRGERLPPQGNPLLTHSSFCKVILGGPLADFTSRTCATSPSAFPL